ncbi:unnamed protein product [Ectocarpus sp. CCAP 1310/34]|nr:unnamed protein product [Ectocarpus sp. CCAP 1310/34]
MRVLVDQLILHVGSENHIYR